MGSVRAASALLAWCPGLVLHLLPATACDLSEPDTRTVAAVIDGETLKLADGRTVRLIGAKAPMPPLGFRGDDPWPMVEEAKDALTRLAASKEVELRYGGTKTDRHGYLLGQVFVVDGAKRHWLQQEMIGAGLARVYSFSDNRACVKELLASEAEARGKGLGVWGSPAYRIESSDDVDGLDRLTQTYQLVEGEGAERRRGGGARLPQFRPRLEERFHHQRGTQRRECLCRSGYRPQDARRQTRARARLGDLAQWSHDRGDSPRADRAHRG
ncbi:MAG: thermonuclease family protein [Actinomycetota bacterium]